MLGLLFRSSLKLNFCPFFQACRSDESSGVIRLFQNNYFEKAELLLVKLLLFISPLLFITASFDKAYAGNTLSLTITSINVSCRGLNDASISSILTGGSGGTVNFSLTPGSLTNTTGIFTNLSSGTYTINADDVGNTATATIIITEPALALNVSVSSNSPACTNSALNLSASVSGGTAPYNYSWTGPNSFSSTNQSPVITNPSVSASGNYSLSVKDANNCSSAGAVPVLVNVAPIVTVNTSINTICAGGAVTLTSSSNIPLPVPTPILTENFNGATPGWNSSNSSSGGTPANAAWTKHLDNYNNGSVTISSNDNSPFYLSDSRSQGGSTISTSTVLESPAFTTMGYSDLTLDFYHYFKYQGSSNEYAKVQVSTNGTTWTDVISYSADQGTSTNFDHATINLKSYINKPTLSIRFFYYSDHRARYWAFDNVSISGTLEASTPIISWNSNPSGFNSSLAIPPTVNPTVTTIYTATYTNQATTCSNSASTTVTVNPKPNVSIQPNYCIVPGHIRLTANGGTNYTWSTGETFNPILVDIANTYSVSSTNSFGCTGTASMPVSTELVTNGDFSAGNIGLTSSYGYVSTGYTGTPTSGLWPESHYAIGTDPTFYHTNFWGRDHTSNSGNFMMVNGSGSNPPVVAWQQTVSVIQNTDYYFAAWAASLNSVSPYANLQFSVNGVLVGTTAPLSGRISDNNPPYNWQRFYGNWNSGIATIAIIQIVDLQTALGGNDFGLDDISFGTLAPIPFTIAPFVNPSSTICSGKTMYLKANPTGGKPPMSYSWTGPNGFTSNLKDPVIPDVTVAYSGTYTLSVTDGYGCDPDVKTTNATILPSPNPLISSLSGPGGICPYSQVKYWNSPQSNITNSWTVIGGNIIGSAIKDTVDIKWSASGIGKITLKSTNTVTLCDSTITKSVVIQDLIPPDLGAPAPFNFCVEDLISAEIVSNILKINPTPDLFLLKKGSTSLDVDRTGFFDNCTPSNQLVLHWRIDFSGATPSPSISGTGQPSAYLSDISFPGDGVTFLDVIHTITYWAIDQTGNESIHKSVAITIHPRPIVSYHNQNSINESIDTFKKQISYEKNYLQKLFDCNACKNRITEKS